MLNFYGKVRILILYIGTLQSTNLVCYQAALWMSTDWLYEPRNSGDSREFTHLCQLSCLAWSYGQEGALPHGGEPLRCALYITGNWVMCMTGACYPLGCCCPLVAPSQRGRLEASQRSRHQHHRQVGRYFTRTWNPKMSKIKSVSIFNGTVSWFLVFF